MAVSADGRLFASREFVERTPAKTLMAVLEHEAWHLMLQHSDRAQAAKVELINNGAWNAAADAEIHSGYVAREGLSLLQTLPGGIVTPATLSMPDGLLAEEYYNALPAKDAASYAGSGSDGIQRSYERAQEGDDDVAPITPSEARAIREEVARSVEQAKSRGELPGGADRWASGILTPPKVDWRKLLRRRIQEVVEVAGRTDYSYRRPNRRDAGASRGYISPGTIAHAVSIAVVIDTSGSVSAEGLSTALSETIGITRAVGGSVRAAACDSAAASFRTVRKASDIKFVGGGGTDMRVGIAAAHKLKPRPQTIVVITDGGTPWPRKKPAITTIAVIVEGQDTTPSWMTSVEVK